MKCDSSRDTSDASRKYHLVGVGGAGMSALAQLLLALGNRVSGSDRYYDQGRELDVLKKLRSLGVNLLAQDGRAVTESLDAVIISTAIENDNPDLVAARLKGIPVVHRAEMLANLARAKECIAVTGTAGKSTVTGMIGWTLAELGMDPTVVNGAAVLNWVSGRNPGNFRFGRSNLWVLELDESDRSLLRFSPDWAVVTNVSKDHFELAEVRELFALFSRQVKKGIVGCNPLNGWDAKTYENPLQNYFVCHSEPFGCTQDRRSARHRRVRLWRKESRYRRFRLFLRSLGRTRDDPVPFKGFFSAPSEFVISSTEQGIIFRYHNVEFRLSLLGRHNAENALHCVMLCEKFGLDLNDVSKALEKFAGIERRLEVIGRTGGVIVIDDYAHNPAKIAAAWQTVEPLARRIIAVWRPHGYGPLALMRREIIDVFLKHVRPEDRIIIMSVYFAGGTASKEVTARMLVDDLERGGLPVGYVENYEDLLPVLLKSAAAGDAVLFMGARDPDLPVFARSFVFKLNNFIMNRMSGSGGIAQEDEPADQA